VVANAAANAAFRTVSEDAIVGACTAGNVSHLQHWGRQGVRVTSTEPFRHSIYIGASFKEAPTFDALSCLVKELGADVNQRDENRLSALMYAVHAGDHDVLRYLVEELGAQINMENKFGHTPFWAAACSGKLGVVRVLLKLGANIDQRSKTVNAADGGLYTRTSRDGQVARQGRS
jgi:hypothetical protein